MHNEKKVLNYPTSTQNSQTGKKHSTGNNSRIANSTELERAIEKLQNDLKEVKAQATVRKPVNSTNLSSFPPNIKALTKEKNGHQKRARLTQDPEIKREANRLQEEVKRQIRKYRNETWEAKLSNLKPEDNSLWKLKRVLQ